MKESYLEARCVKLAEQEGWLSYKVVSPGKRGMPDRLFIRDGRSVFVEFKVPAGVVGPHQKIRIAELLAESLEVHVVRSESEFTEKLGIG